MRPEIVAVSIATLVASFALSWLARKLAIAHGVLDVPNSRSSHSVPTPRGGGIGIVLSASGAFVALALMGRLEPGLLLALLGGGIAVAFVGMLDDRGHVPAGLRLLVHVAAAAWAVWCLGGLPPLRVGPHLASLGIVGDALAVVGIVWALNLFNFMDGIDGIAASEGVFVAWGAAGLAVLAGTGEASSALLFGMACAGFLCWNWPPARIFMGDAGSGYVGYVIAVLALAAVHADAAAIWPWTILAGLFLADATVTLVRRMCRGELVHQAHRSHAYQHLARRWGQHWRVTVAAVLVNVLWLLPCAALATLRPRQGAWITLIALAPVFVMAIVSGGGRKEEAPCT